MPHIALPEDLPGITSAFAFRPETAKPMRELAEVLLRGPQHADERRARVDRRLRVVQERLPLLPCQPPRGGRASSWRQLRSRRRRDSGSSAAPVLESSRPCSRSPARCSRAARTSPRRTSSGRARRERPTGNPRHRAHRRGVLHVQPLRRRPGHLHPDRSSRPTTRWASAWREKVTSDSHAQDAEVPCASAACLLATSSAFAQDTTGAIEGASPTRPRRAIAGARVVATQPRHRLHEGDDSRRADGFYRLLLLPVGRYSVTDQRAAVRRAGARADPGQRQPDGPRQRAAGAARRSPRP